MQLEYSALAEFTLKTWWWPCAVTLATAWFWRQSVRGKKGGAEGVKSMLVIANATVGVLIFRSILPTGFAGWLHPGLSWANGLSHWFVFLFFLTALLWLLDLALGRTPLILPRNPVPAITVIAGCTLGLMFPVLEWVAGNRLPHAQAFGVGSVPLLIFSAALLGGSRPGNWLGKLLLIAILLCSSDALASAVADKHWHYLAAPLFSLAAVAFTWLRPRFIALAGKS